MVSYAENQVRRYYKSDLTYFLAIFVPPLLLLGALLALIYYMEVMSKRTLYERSEKQIVDTVKFFLADDFRLVASDLFYLADRKDIKSVFMQKNDVYGQVAKDIQLLSEKRLFYDQIRILDLYGIEKLRVDLEHDKAKIFSPEELEDKRNRYYFKEAIILNKGDLYLSPFDLNIEWGRIERPIKPMIRLATPLYNDDDEKIGLIVLNYLGKELTKKFRQTASNGEGKVMLLNEDAYFLSSPHEEDEWGFVLKEKVNRRFSVDYPEAWEKIVISEEGQFRNEKGLFTYHKIHPLEKIYNSISGGNSGAREVAHGREHHWYVVSFFSSEAEKEKVSTLLVKLAWFYLIIGGVIASGCLLTMRIRRKNIKAEKELIHKRRLAAMGEMSAHLAHEIKNPLNRLGLAYEMLRESKNIMGAERKVVNALGDTLEGLFTVAMELLDFSRKDSLNTEIFDISLLITKITEEYMMKCSEKGISLETSFDENVRITGDKLKVDHLLRNLMDNAVQAMTDGGILSLFLKKYINRVEIGVKDTGSGISSEDMDNIFVPFFTTKNEGSGLGMPIVKHFTELHGGEISIDSRLGLGTAVTLFLPLS